MTRIFFFFKLAISARGRKTKDEKRKKVGGGRKAVFKGIQTFSKKIQTRCVFLFNSKVVINSGKVLRKYFRASCLTFSILKRIFIADILEKLITSFSVRENFLLPPHYPDNPENSLCISRTFVFHENRMAESFQGLKPFEATNLRRPNNNAFDYFLEIWPVCEEYEWKPLIICFWKLER